MVHRSIRGCGVLQTNDAAGVSDDIVKGLLEQIIVGNVSPTASWVNRADKTKAKLAFLLVLSKL